MLLGEPEVIPKQCKRLAEVDFPIAVVSKHAAREKSIRHGHPSTLHLWWARRPLAACRAMLLGLLLPDPCDPHCPQDFKEKARHLLPKVQGSPGPKDDDLRQALLRFIGDFANWDLAAHAGYLEVSRGLVRAAHGDEPPLVVDPFAGGGSIPLEALRLGCEAFASDLNPVACLILKVMLEDIPRHGPELAGELRKAGKEIKDAAEKELGEFYPADPDGARPIAYLWSRTIRCEAPNCGGEIPLLRSFWLCKKANRKRALRSNVVRNDGGLPRIEFEIFEPSSEREVQPGTVSRAKAKCLACNTVLSPDRVRSQLAAQRGGADAVFDGNGQRVGGARLLAVVTPKNGEQGRQYRLPAERDYRAVFNAQNMLEMVVRTPLPSGLNPVPDEPTPAGGGSGAGRAFSVQKYGMMTFGDLFTARQKLALISHSGGVEEQSSTVQSAEAIWVLAPAISKMADTNSVLCTWQIDPPRLRATFARQALPMTWDFAEASPFGEGAGNFELCLDAITEVLDRAPCIDRGTVEQCDATSLPIPECAASVWFTDPPYYDAVPYADLSDFFFVWLKRFLRKNWTPRDPFDPKNQLSPKIREIVQDETKQADGRAKDKIFFEEAMAKAFSEGRRILEETGVGCVVFAHKTTEGWEALLSAMVRAGWALTGSWPIASELQSRQRARESAALATSIHLICRPRPEDASIGDWTNVLRVLPKRVGDWMERLQSEGVRGADLVFACIGPALEIFSRYSKVETAEGREVELAEFLEKVWEVVGKSALMQVLGSTDAKAGAGVTGALEEDARLTALFLWTLQSSNGENTGDEEGGESEDADEEDDAPRGKAKGFSLIFDVARRFAQPLGIHLPDWEGRIIETEKGVVRLLAVTERAKQLFGEEGAQVAADQIERDSKTAPQLLLFPNQEETVTIKGRGRSKASRAAVPDESLRTRREATTLDRVHAAILLQSGGRANALRALLKTEQERSPEFLRLANALSALYPKDSEEKRLLDAMLLAVPR
jgi:putative DNA methylase